MFINKRILLIFYLIQQLDLVWLRCNIGGGAPVVGSRRPSLLLRDGKRAVAYCGACTDGQL